MIHSIPDLLRLGALAGAAVSFAIILWYLSKRPPLGRLAKVMLFLGLGGLSARRDAHGQHRRP